MSDSNLKVDKPSLWTRLKTALSLTKPGATPVNKKICILMILSMFASNYSIVFLIPLTPDMVLHFGYAEEDKGYYTGIILSGLFVGRMVSSVFWGWLADRRGRRFVMTMNLFTLGISCIAFGFAPTLSWAIFLRVVAGLFNGIMAVSKAVLYDISDETNQAATMTSVGYSWAASLGLGPLISGFAVFPINSDSEGLFYKFPFLLPSLIAGIISFVPGFLLLFCMDDTLVVKRIIAETTVESTSKEDKRNKIAKDSNTVEKRGQRTTHSDAGIAGNETEETAFVAQNGDENVTENSEDDDERHTCTISKLLTETYKHDEKQTHMYAVCEQTHQKDKDSVQYRTSATNRSIVTCDAWSLQSDSDRNVQNEENYHHHHVNTEQNMSSHCLCLTKLSRFRGLRIMCIREVKIAILVYCFMALNSAGHDEAVKVWVSTDIYLGGLGFQADKIGVLMGAATAALVFLQALSFPLMERRFGAIKTFQFNALVLIFVCSTIQTTRALYYMHSPAADALLYTMEGLIKLCETNCFTSTALLVNNSVLPQDGGFVNGFGMMCAGLTKTIGPVIGGSIFAWSITYGSQISFPFDINCVFLFFGFCYIVCNICISIAPESLNSKRKSY